VVAGLSPPPRDPHDFFVVPTLSLEVGVDGGAPSLVPGLLPVAARYRLRTPVDDDRGVTSFRRTPAALRIRGRQRTECESEESKKKKWSHDESSVF
jgi:hypothetical protein